MTDEEYARLAQDPRVGGFIARGVEFCGGLVYIGGVPKTDHDWVGFGVFAAFSFLEQSAIHPLPMPPQGEEPRDLVVRDDKVYLLAATQDGSSFRTRIYATNDLSQWDLVVEFEAAAPAYSIEVHSGYLYVGLGGDNPASGSVCRVRLPQ